MLCHHSEKEQAMGTTLSRLSGVLCCGTFVAIVLSHASLACAQVARIEVYPVESMTLTDDEFLAGKKDGKPVTLAGELRIPRPGTARLPAVVLVHGSGGVSGYVADWSQFLNGLGVATFTLDSFTGRGIASTIDDQSRLGRLAMIVDTYRALELLTKHPRIDPARVAVMGFSRGGGVALFASLRRFQRTYAAAGSEFAGYLVLYGNCGTKYRGDDDVSDRPIRLFHGTADDWVPVAPCRSFVERLRAKGKDISLTEYANAGHVFDGAAFAKPVRLANAQTWSRCKLEEVDGKVVNAETGQPFTFKDPCVQLGATVAYDAEAHKAALLAVQEFAVSVLGAK
jgi:dienelactone hydrolase